MINDSFDPGVDFKASTFTSFLWQFDPQTFLNVINIKLMSDPRKRFRQLLPLWNFCQCQSHLCWPNIYRQEDPWLHNHTHLAPCLARMQTHLHVWPWRWVLHQYVLPLKGICRIRTESRWITSTITCKGYLIVTECSNHCVLPCVCCTWYVQ